MCAEATTAHPRSRGENAYVTGADALCSGSSPLTRGKLTHAGLARRERGLIPAHAGKTTATSRSAQPWRAHPRSRGENTWRTCPELSPQGSSPLTRGKLSQCLHFCKVGRLIPAHAGKTSLVVSIGSCAEAHPRSRGENDAALPRPLRKCGSSPLTRGKHGALAACETVQRLIPAHAGKTLPDMRFYCADRSDLGNP